MSHKLPVISGEDLVKYLAKQGFEAKRQDIESRYHAETMAGLFCSAAPGTKERTLDRYS